ncbi:hypothetical protein [Clostridium hydrogeniformans]|uniref:hypothetical protein n=1 Tax=Clostridium hydrogeniformans TaxID=349933 RepID=UPI000691995F|nr:hypothetical protein [Clostridium hydrogeniformans]
MKLLKCKTMLLSTIFFLLICPTVTFAYDGNYYDFNKSSIEDLSNGSDDILGKGNSLGFTLKLKDEDSRWQSGGIDHTHQFLTSKAIKILINDKGQKYEKLIYPYAHKLLIGSDLPDTDERFPLYAHHFYNPYIKKNYLLYKDTAKSRFVHHSLRAKELYSTDKELAFEELGRAFHYLADLNEPHHASNAPAIITNHSLYEKWVDDHRKNYGINSASSYDLCYSESYESFLNTVAEKSAYNAYSYMKLSDKKYIEPYGIYPLILNDTKSFDKSAKATLSYCQDLMASCLFRFFEETKS